MADKHDILRVDASGKTLAEADINVDGAVFRRTDTEPGIAVRYRTLSMRVERTLEEERRRKKPGATNPAEAMRDINSAAIERKRAGPRNAISPPPTQYWRKIVQYVFGGFNAMMWLAFVVTLLSYKPLGDPNPQILNLGVAILLMAVIIISAAFYAIVDFNANKIMASIRGLVAQEATVVRNGIKMDIPAEEVLVGDIIVLSLGQRVPADVRLIEVSPDLKFDRSLLTGESDPVAGSVAPTEENPLETRNIALSSTFVVQGSATGVCFGIGDDSIMGRIVKLSGTQKNKLTPIQRELNIFTLIISTFNFNIIGGGG
ncbi:E1-E2 ATPase-domain-containing protein [Blyttiomyces helicus]|uniref:E1-E2 ATPase-domain-containing protein n=1 Tax=Blyttiomyces helicus TaxID=388810 RepID=A0A4P9WIM3_9FUNG|nr:E1-E2 ATPase-domain-containing protein [Blyttiomyces helicus]|eukprot:RKO91743.1 E1-E2 ATPase-domain-containing protein [Blyttiomyces helicus]